MDNTSIIITIVTTVAVLSGALITIIKFLRSNKHDHIDYAKKIEAFYEKRDSKLSKRIKALETKVESLLEERDGYKRNIERQANYSEELKEIIKEERLKSNSLDEDNQKLEKEVKYLKDKLSNKKKKDES